MTACPHHPDREATTVCDYCGGAHCGACVVPLLGRSYCSGCYPRVYTLATGKTLPKPAAGDGPAAGSAVAGASRLPGWLSALAFGAGLVPVLWLSRLASEAPLQAVASLARRAGNPTDPTGNPLGTEGIGLGVWTALLFIAALGPFVAVLLYTHVMARGVERQSLLALGLEWPRRAGRTLLLGGGLAAALALIVFGYAAGKGWLQVDARLGLPQAVAMLAGGVLVLLPLALLEEVALRGYLLRSLARSAGPAAGVVAAALASVALHAANSGDLPITLPRLLGIGLFALVLGVAAAATRNLWLSIVLHGGWLFARAALFGAAAWGWMLPTPAFDVRAPAAASAWTGGIAGPEAGALFWLAVLPIPLLILLLRPLLIGQKELAAPAVPEPPARAVPIGPTAPR
ncbi:MAG: type II CAAX prenyl endopeptidase Rce1 family protein [Armatimonadota bacterium]